MIKWLKSRGYTDRLYFLNLTLVWIFVVVCIVLSFMGLDHEMGNFDIISYGLPAAFGELGIHTGFVVWKAKHENLNKYPRAEVPTDDDDYIEEES